MSATKEYYGPWSADCHAVQQAARGIVAHYEGEAWRGTQEEYRRRVNKVANLIAAIPAMLKACGETASGEHWLSCPVSKPSYTVASGEGCTCCVSLAHRAYLDATCGIGPAIAVDGPKQEGGAV